MTSFWNFLTAHGTALSAAAIYVLVALRATMPPPGMSFSFYQWLYDFTGVLVNQHQRPTIPAATPVNLKYQPED